MYVPVRRQSRRLCFVTTFSFVFVLVSVWYSYLISRVVSPSKYVNAQVIIVCCNHFNINFLDILDFSIFSFPLSNSPLIIFSLTIDYD